MPRATTWFLSVLTLVVLLGGACTELIPGVGVRPAQQAQWTVDPAFDLDPAATEIPLLVVEAECASGRDATGRVSLDVEEDGEQVVVTAWVRPRPGDQTCQGNPPTDVTLELGSPLAGRDLVNGATDEIARRPVDLGDDGPDPGSADDPGPVVGVADGGTLPNDAAFIIEALHLRARDHGDLQDLNDLSPASDGLQLWLGPQLVRTAPLDDLHEPDGWVMDVEQYAGWSGPFSVLETLAGAPQLEGALGARPHCASPARPSPDELADLTRVAISPALDSNSSCLEWFVVNLYLDDESRLHAVQLDLWEP